MLLRPGEAAEMLGFSRSTVYSLIATGQLPSVRIGGSTRVPLAGLRAWLAEKAAASPGILNTDGAADGH
jgi:excisionase family DNA binding protein